MKHSKAIQFLLILFTAGLLLPGCGTESDPPPPPPPEETHPFEGGEGTAENPYQIADIEQLQAIDDTLYLDKHFIQIADIDASASAEFENEVSGLNGFDPIGDADYPFTGFYDGDGFLIVDLHLPFVWGNRVKGLFGYIKDAQIENITVDNQEQLKEKMENQDIYRLNELQLSMLNAQKNTDLTEHGGRGGIAGINEGGIIRNCHFTGRVNAAELASSAAGFVGINTGTIEDSSFNGRVSGGGASGFVLWNTGTIINSHTIVRADGMSAYGFASTNEGLIAQSSAVVDLSGSHYEIGFVVFNNDEGRIENSFSKGTILGGSTNAGLVAENRGTIINSYSHVEFEVNFITGVEEIRLGHIATKNLEGGVIEASYAAGNVTFDAEPATFITGGFVAENVGEIRASYWDIESTGQDEGVGTGSAEGATGLATTQMSGPGAEANMPGFDWETVWRTTEAGYPVLRWEEE